ncbi:uncharacterized protein PF3D7_1120000-like [Anolis sagrei]|uniref:uncharacterized protein PF3D7_1120000-like n=1 Tax=Anolis sagrei TaxID=38937 RepID=UPI00352130C2
MTTPKNKGEKTGNTEKVVEQPEQRRGSVSGNPTGKEILKEVQKILEQQEAYQEKQDAYQKVAEEQRKRLKNDLTEELAKMRKEITNELGEMKKEMDAMRQDMRKNQTDVAKLEEAQETINRKLEDIELREEQIETKLDQAEQKELEYYLRFRNIQEEAQENLRQIIVSITAELLEIAEEDAETNIDRTYRITTGYAKKYKVERDVIVQFGRKHIRDEILKRSSKNPPYFKNKKVTILKEHTQSTIQRRRKYKELTDELKRQNIRFRWERGEGLMATYKNERTWITSEEKAKDFLRTIRMNKEGKEYHHVPGVQTKRSRTESPEKAEEASNTLIPSLERIPEKQEEHGENNQML